MTGLRSPLHRFAMACAACAASHLALAAALALTGGAQELPRAHVGGVHPPAASSQAAGQQAAKPQIPTIVANA
ncbi:MAG: hypothetical protein ACRDOE_23655, partial [Streptosporangiaceae bacterium]